MFAIVSRTHDRAKKVQLKLLASCAMATSMLSANVAQAGTELPPPLTGADTAFQGIATVAVGDANIVRTPTLDTITVSTANTVINFTPFDTANGGGPISFLPSGRSGLFVNDPNSGVTNFTVLNRVIPTDATRAIRFDGTVQARIADAMGGSTPGGTILFYSPGGIIASATSVFDVGSLVLSAADIGFGSGSTLNFSGATPGTSVDINSGASILAQGVGSYVAFVAPRVVQSGSVKSDGSVAYIAAEAVDVTIQNNLFDISFVQGTDGGTAVAHTGTTEFTRAAGDTSPQRIYVASVAKNDAITSLVSGSLGYTAATSVAVQNGAIILSSGRNLSETGYGGVVFSDTEASAAPANLTIGADTPTVFNSSLLTNATGDALIAPAAGMSISFNGDVTLNADRLAEVRAVANSSATFGGNLAVSSNNLVEGSAARVIALGEVGYGATAGIVSVNGALTIDGGDGATSTAELKADLGHISVAGSTSLLAATDKSLGLNVNGDASGGTATVQVGALGSQLVLGSPLSVDASAKAGTGIDSNETPIPGNAVGGTSRLLMGGGTFVASSVNLKSDASATPGGNASGGTVTLTTSGGATHTGTISASANAFQDDTRSDATGPSPSTDVFPSVSAMTPANVTGGNIQLNVVNTTMNIDGDLLLHADAMSQSGLGGLQGGTVSINVDHGRLLVGDSINASANAEESASSIGVTPGLVKGGSVDTAAINDGDILSSAMNFDANAASGGDTRGGLVALQTMTGGSVRSIGTIGIGAAATSRDLESGGNATGGQLLVNITSGELISGPLTLDASAVGGDAVSGAAGGTATGGTAMVNISGGDSTIEIFSLTTDATGGKGGLAAQSDMAGGNGGAAVAGIGEVNLTGGSLRTAGFTITSSAIGGDGGDGAVGGSGATATGGRAAVLTSEAASLFLTRRPTDPNPLPFPSSVNSSASGGIGGFGSSSTGGIGGIGNGGTAILSLAGAEYLPSEMPFAVTLSAESNGVGGAGGGSAVGQAGNGGAGVGGSASVSLINNLIDFGDVSAESAGVGGQGGSVGAGYGTPFMGGAGGSGNGGSATINLTSPAASMSPTNIATLSAIADATGGLGGFGDIAGAGGSAISHGTASISQSAGSILASSITLSANSLAANGTASAAGATTLSVGQAASLTTTTLSGVANANAGVGSALGGQVNILADGGTLIATNTMLSANGSSSVLGSEVGGRGGTVDIRAVTSPPGPDASLALGTVTIAANGVSILSGGMGATGNASAGRINIAAIGSQTTSTSLTSLTATTLGQNALMSAPTAGIFVTADQGQVAVNGAASFTSDESVSIAATGNGNLSVGNDLNVSARNQITISHSGRVSAVNTVQSGAATFTAGNNFTGQTDSSLRASNDLSITSQNGSVVADILSAGNDLVINAGGSVDLTGLAQTTAASTGYGSSDISISAAGAVSLDLIDAAGNFSVSADSLIGTRTIMAGEDVTISTNGAISAPTIIAGDDVMATSIGGTISIASATARGIGPDNDMRGADIRLQSTTGAISLNSAMSNDDIFLTSLGNITASDLTASGTGGLGNRKGIIVDSASSVMLTNISSQDSIAVRGASITATQFTAGEDIALSASGAISLQTARSGDDVTATSSVGDILLTGIHAMGNGPDDRSTDFGYGGIGFVATAADGSNVNASAGYGNLNLGLVDAVTDIVGSAASISSTSNSLLAAGRDVSLTAQNLISIKDASATRDISLTSMSDGVTVQGLIAGDDINVSASGAITLASARTNGLMSGGMGPDTNDISIVGATVSIDNATAKDNLSIDADDSVNFTTLTSTGNTSISAGTDIAGGTATAGALLSVTADSVDVTNLNSTTNDVVVNARLIDVGGISAGQDALIDTAGMSDSMISLGTVFADRDIVVTGGTNGISALVLTAGDDINVIGSAGVNIVTSNATGAANSGYGVDTSDVNVTASQITLANTSARNNVSLTSSSSLTASQAIAELGNVNVNAMTSANIAETRALQGSVNVTADRVSLATVNAGTDVVVNYGADASTTTVVAGNLINISGTGNSSFFSLNSGGATRVIAGGNINGGSASAGGMLTMSSASLNADSLTSRNDSVNITAASSVIASGSAAVDLLINTGSAVNGAIVVNSATAARDVKLLATSGFVTVTDATAGDDIEINAGGAINSTGTLRTTGLGRGISDSDIDLTAGSTINLQSVDAFTDIGILAAPGGTMIAGGLAGDDIDFNVAGNVSAGLLRTTGAQANGTDSDIMVTTTGMATVNVADAFSDFESSAESFSGNNLTAGEDIEISTQGAASVMSAMSGDDTVITSVSGPISVGNANANGTGPDDEEGGSDVRLRALGGSISVGSATAGDEVDLAASGTIMATSLTAAGINPDDDRSNVLIDSGAGVTLSIVTADATIAIRAADLTGNLLTAGEDVAIQTIGSATINNASAGDDFMITSSSGRIGLGTITTRGDGLDDRTADFGYGDINFLTTPADGSRIDASALDGNIVVDSLNSHGATDLFASDTIVGPLRIGSGSVSAGGLLTANANLIMLNTATSRADSAQLTAETVTLANGMAAVDFSINTGETPDGLITATNIMAGRDISLTSTNNIFVKNLNAGRNIDILAGAITATGSVQFQNGTSSAGNNLTVEAFDISGANDMLVAGTDASLTAGGSISGGITVTAGRDVSASAAGDTATFDATAGDDISVSTSTGSIVGMFTTTGTAVDEDGSNITLNSATSTDATTTNAFDTLRITAGSDIFAQSLISGDDTLLNADGDVIIRPGEGAPSATSIDAGGNAVVNAGGDISFLSIDSGLQTALSAGGRVGFAGDSAILAGTSVVINADGDINLDSVESGSSITSTSGANTSINTAIAGTSATISTSGNFTLGTISAGQTIMVDGSAGSLGTATAGTDINLLVGNGGLSGGMLTAGRDINVEAGYGLVSLTNLLAGDDIDLQAVGMISLGTARTTGLFNGGYGSDPSDITLNASSSDIGTAQARDNVLIQTANGTTAANLTAERGSITVDGGTFADIGTASASLGSIGINADVVTAETLDAGIDANIDFGANASLGSVTAGRDVSIIGMGDANADSISAKRDVTTMVGGNVAITSGTAGRNLRNSSTNFSASNLIAGSDIVVLTDESADLGTASATGRIVTNAGTSIAFANLNSGLSTSLVAGTAITGGNANAGTTLSLNANGGGVIFGTLTSGGNTTITAQAQIAGTSASAGGALTIDSSAVGVTATSLSAGTNSNLTVTASNGGNATIGNASAGQDISVNATNVNVTTGSATRDVIYAGSRMVNAGTTTSGRDIRFTAGSNLVSDVATATGLISANSVGNSQLNSSTADNIFVVASGDTTIGSAVAGTFIGINTNDAVASTLTAGEDIRLIASGTANVTTATAGDDVDISAVMGGTLGNISATATARDDRNLVFNAPSFTTVDFARDGSEVRIASSGAVTAANIDAGDDIRINTGNFTLTGTALTRGLGATEDGSNVLITAAAATLGTVNAAGSIFSNSDSFAANVLRANREITVLTRENASLGNATSVQDRITAFSDRGTISFAELAANSSILLTSAGGSILGGNAQAGSFVSLFAADSIEFDSITSGSSTDIFGNSVVGNSINALDSVNIAGDFLDIQNISSDFGSIFLTGRDINVGTAGARFDFVAQGDRGEELLPNERITLGDIVAGRDILLSGAEDRLTATSLRAGDDIDIDILGNAKIGLAITDGTFGGGYGDDGYGDVARPTILRSVDSGYGLDLSNITLDASQAMIGTARANDNVTLTTGNGTMAGSIVADNGDILVNGGTSAMTSDATALLGTVTINANSVDVGEIDAGIDVAVNFGSVATLGTAVAGSKIDVIGMGDLDLESLTSGDATTIATDGAVTGGSALAGGLLSLTAGSIDVDSLTSSGSSILASARDVSIDSASALIDLNVDTKSLSESSISLGTATAGRDILLTGGTAGISATALTAGDDIMVAGSGTVTIGDALTSGLSDSGYGESGYGNGTSNIMIDADQIMIGTARARDDVALTSSASSTATTITADRGAVTIGSGTSAVIGSATATLGSVSINADTVDADNIAAGTDVSVEFGESATLGAVTADASVNLTGDGDLEYDELRSGAATSISVDGSASGGSAFAGTSFTATTGQAFAASGTTEAAGLVSITGDSLDVADVLSGTTTTLTADRAISTGNVATGTGLTILSGTTATTRMLTASTNDIRVDAVSGMTIGGATATSGNVTLTNTSGTAATGALTAGEDVAVTNGGVITIESATAADDVRVVGGASATVGTASTTGGIDGDGDGNDIAISAMGPLSVTMATTQRGALANSDIALSSTSGSANLDSGTALGNLAVTAATSLTTGSASAGANLSLTGQSISATALTAARSITSSSSGATNIADARATGGNLTVTAAGILTMGNGGALGDIRLTSTAGGNVTTGTLSSGSAFTGATTGGMPGPGDITIMSDGNAVMTGNSSAGRNLNVTAKNQISVSGVSNAVGIDLKSSDIVINSQTGRVGEQGRTTQIQLTNTGSGTTTIGGAGVTGSYSLANAEAQRLFAGDIIIAAVGTGDTIVDALTLTGATGQTGATGGNIGASGRLRIETPGKLRTIGAASISGLSAANRFQVSASQGIEVDAATGSISLTGAAGAPGGTLELTAPTVVAASQTATSEIAALTDGRAINDRLAINDGAISDAGNFTADSIVANVSNGFFVQNSGIKEISAFSFGDRRGITVGAGGLTINAASPTTRIFVSGRQLQPNGSFLTGVDFLRRQSINGTQVQLSIFPPTPFDPASTVNGCAIINSASCLINIDGGSLARDVVGQSDEDSGGSGGNGSSSDANFVQFQFKNLDEANFQAVIDDPVTGVGNDDLWALYDAKACADDQSLEGCSSPK